MESPSNGDLPAEIMREILLRLPVRSLLKFKYVCKHWYTLIGSQSFINQHFGHESNQERLLIGHMKPHGLGYTFALYVDEMFSRYEEPDHLKVLEKAAVILGPLNGVFCVANCVHASTEVALLNPAMRQFKPLPLIHWNFQPPLTFNFDLLGFGLELLSGDYKLVRVRYFWNKEMNIPHYPPFVYVYNSGNESWRHLENVDFVKSMEFASRSLCETYFNGVYYWVMELCNRAIAILAFDMSSETFQEIQVPDCILSRRQILNLSVYDDSVALLSYDCIVKIDRWINVWVMVKEGCWTKCLTLGPFQGLLWPIGFWKTNQLLLDGETSVLALDVANQKLRTVAAPGRKSNTWRSWFFCYKESLDSLKREGDNCKLWDTSSDFVKDSFLKYF